VSDLLGIIIAAGVFIGGLNAIGSIDRMIEALKEAQSAALRAAKLDAQRKSQTEVAQALEERN